MLVVNLKSGLGLGVENNYGIQEAVSSILSSSTKNFKGLRKSP